MQQFGDIWIDVEHIISVGFAYKKDFGKSDSGLTVLGAVRTLDTVTIILDSGGQITFDGDSALKFKEYWDFVNREVGNVA